MAKIRIKAVGIKNILKELEEKGYTAETFKECDGKTYIAFYDNHSDYVATLYAPVADTLADMNQVVKITEI